MSVLKDVIFEVAVNEFSDSVNVVAGRMANHGMLGNVKVQSIVGSMAEVIDRNGKHLRVQLSSLHPGEVRDESLEENYDKHSAAAASHDKDIERGQADRELYKSASKHHERAAKTAPSDALQKMHNKKSEQYLEKSKTVEESLVNEFSSDVARSYIEKANKQRELETAKMHKSGTYDHKVVDKMERRAEATMKLKHKLAKKSVDEAGFPYDVDHMNGAIHRNAPRITDNVEFKFYKDWERAVNQLNSEKFDDECEFISDTHTKQLVDPTTGTVIAIWKRGPAPAQGKGWVNVRGQRVRPMRESVDAAALHVGDPVKIIGRVEYSGETGVFVDAGIGGAFVVIRLDSDGTKHSFHSSDVEYYEGDDNDDDEFYESVTELAMPYSEFESPKLWSSVARKAGYNVQASAQGQMLKAYNKHGDLVGKYDADKNKGFMAGSSTNEAHKLGDEVTITKGPKDVIGKKGKIGEIRHGAFKGAAKTYTVDHDAGSVQLSKSQFKGGKSMKENTEMRTILEEALNETYGRGYGRDSWDSNMSGYQDREQRAMDNRRQSFKSAEMDQELGHERNNYSVNIDGRAWKVFYDKRRAEGVARSIMNKYPSKRVSVHPTGAPVSEAVKKQAPAPRNFVAKNAKMGGAGAHKDEKRAAKQGEQKHKGKLEEAEDGYAKVEKAIAQHKRTLKNKLATPANVAHAQKMIARGNAALKKETGEAAYKHFQGSVNESLFGDLLALSEKL